MLGDQELRDDVPPGLLGELLREEAECPKDHISFPGTLQRGEVLSRTKKRKPTLVLEKFFPLVVVDEPPNFRPNASILKNLWGRASSPNSRSVGKKIRRSMGRTQTADDTARRGNGEVIVLRKRHLFALPCQRY